MSVPLPRHRFSIEDFQYMNRQGVFAPDARLELIEGEIYEMPPIGNLHAGTVDFLSKSTERLIGDKFIIRVQSSIVLNEKSQPQPDISILKYRKDFYRHSHPTPEDVLLLIEVSDTTVQYDRQFKIPFYAAAEIQEAWLVNLPEQRVEVYSQPENGRYKVTKIYGYNDIVSSTTISELTLSAKEIFG